jgi:hypothetical protein
MKIIFVIAVVAMLFGCEHRGVSSTEPTLNAGTIVCEEQNITYYDLLHRQGG